MPYFSWSDEYSIGIPEIDEQHKKLFEIINDLYNYIVENKHIEGMIETFKKLSDYVNIHFSSEEELMKKLNYPDYFNHKKEHEYLIFQIRQKYQEALKVEKRNISLINKELLVFIRDWLINHIGVEDKKIYYYTKKN